MTLNPFLTGAVAAQARMEDAQRDAARLHEWRLPARLCSCLPKLPLQLWEVGKRVLLSLGHFGQPGFGKHWV
jgi:hypothetical protein